MIKVLRISRMKRYSRKFTRHNNQILSKCRSFIVCCSTNNYSPVLNRLGCSLCEESLETAAMSEGKRAFNILVIMSNSCHPGIKHRGITVRSKTHATRNFHSVKVSTSMVHTMHTSKLCDHVPRSRHTL